MENKIKGPLRAVVLDNDETTGSYGIVFSLLTYLSKYPEKYGPEIHSILAKLAYWMEDNNVFRPGLRYLITTLIELRKIGKIDDILMYTNQRHEVPHEHEGSSYELLYSPPLAISFMMDVLFSTNIFDSHFTRPKKHWGASSVIPKYFERILDAYPERPKDSRYIIFVDDLALPEYILHTNIKPEYINSSSLVRVSQYTKLIEKDQLSDLMILLFGLCWFQNEELHGIIKQYFSRAPAESSSNSQHVFVKLGGEIQKFFKEN